MKRVGIRRSAERGRQASAMRNVGVGVVSAGLLSMLVACGSSVGATTNSSKKATTGGSQSQAALVRKAKKEGSLTLYDVEPASVIQSITRGFEKKYGIKVNAFTTTSGPLATKFQSEVSAGDVQADVIQIGQHTILDQDSRVMLNMKNVPGYAQWPSTFKGTDWTTVQVEPKGMVVNTNMVKSGSITAWKDILQPQYKGKIAMVETDASTTTESLYVTLDKRFGDNFIRSLAAQAPTFEAGDSPCADAVASGQDAICLAVGPSGTTPLIQQHAPIKVLNLNPMTGSEIDMGVLKKSKHLAAAELFASYVMSRAGQELMNGGSIGTSPLRGIKKTVPLPKTFAPPNEAVSNSAVQHVMSLLGESQ